MDTQNYLMVYKTTNIVDNIVVWDGDINTWNPPAEYLMLVQATTPTKTWKWNTITLVWELTAEGVLGNIGWTWDGTYLTTNEPQPTPITAAKNQPPTTGTQTV